MGAAAGGKQTRVRALRAQPQKCRRGTADEALAAAVKVGGRVGCSAGATVLAWSRKSG